MTMPTGAVLGGDRGVADGVAEGTREPRRRRKSGERLLGLRYPRVGHG
jgi:hypothetical protein